MKVEKYQGSDLRSVLMGMISNDVLLSRVATYWEGGGLFDNDFANRIGDWCIMYLAKHKKAPTETGITRMFESWVDQTTPTEEMITATELFLDAVLDEDDEIDTSLLMQTAADYFTKVRITNEMVSVEGDLKAGHIHDAFKRVTEIAEISLKAIDYDKPAVDLSYWNQCLDVADRRSLFRYPDAAGEFFKGAFCRGDLYAFAGPDKTGKSAYLIDAAFRALRARHRVAFFDTGDSNREEVGVRFAQRIARCPHHTKDIMKPVKWEELPGADGEEKGDLELERDPERVEGVDAWAVKRVLDKYSHRLDKFRVACYPNSTLSLSGLRAQLRDWEVNGWVPDVVVIDYVDIMDMAGSDDLNKIDETWKGLRRLTQEKNCLVITATQTNAAAYGKTKGWLGPKHFSGRKTKNAHVVGMIGINVSSEERSTHQSRLNWIVNRYPNSYSGKPGVYLAGCFDVQNPIIISRW
jgi:hypothetical protein